jgi:hypothetical protein
VITESLPVVSGPLYEKEKVRSGWIGAESLNERPTSVRMPTLPQSTSDVVSKCAAELPAQVSEAVAKITGSLPSKRS